MAAAQFFDAGWSGACGARLVARPAEQRLHHAYLFTGTRGVGKTTIARILAKSLNCETGITATPCGCSACQEIDSGRFVDLLEVDAATNTRVDEMRQLLENGLMRRRGVASRSM